MRLLYMTDKFDFGVLGRLGKANILFCGFTAVQAEICKNLGIRSVTINDCRVCESETTGAHLFLNHQHLGRNVGEAAQEGVRLLNPHVIVRASAQPLAALADTFGQYHLVCTSGLTPDEILAAGAKARASNAYYFHVDTFGYFGYMLQDLGLGYAYEVDNKDPALRTSGTIDTVPLSEAMSVNDNTPLFVVLKALFQYWSRHHSSPSNSEGIEQMKLIKNTLLEQHKATQRQKRQVTDQLVEMVVNHLGTELSPVCAIVGGVVAQEILKIICHNDKPFNNSFFFSGLDDSGRVANLFNAPLTAPVVPTVAAQVITFEDEPEKKPETELTIIDID